MNIKHKKFAENYVLNIKTKGNAEQSAIESGYSRAYSRGNAHKLVAKGCIKAYIEKLQREEAEKYKATKEQAIIEARRNYESAHTHAEKKYWYDLWVNLQGWLVQKQEITQEIHSYESEQINTALREARANLN